jgi:pimeloyl-ACP methyl ester carboxylesterase
LYRGVRNKFAQLIGEGGMAKTTGGDASECSTVSRNSEPSWMGLLGIHFIHVRSRHENALPMILTHGWPGSIVEFYKVIEPLVNPTAFGGDSKDAFHVVIPSLPGFGFSD